MVKEASRFRVIAVCYAVVCGALLLYSFTQIDLNLTLSRAGIFQTLQRIFQNIGYYQRPFSTCLYLSILAGLFLLYGWVVRVIRQGNLAEREFWKLVLLITALLVLSYPAFSYDMFNYMFTAKTVLVYHKNPYGVIPLQFSGYEPWLTFMRWTHLPSAYPPVWIFLTLPAYIFGFGFFLLTMWNIKLIVAAMYLLAVWAIGKIAVRMGEHDKVASMALFALNPIVLIEGLVSGHNDIAMMGIALAACVMLIEKKDRFSSFLVLALSVGTKFMTIFLTPLWLWGWNRFVALALMTAGFAAVLLQREVLPWYYVWIMPFISLFPKRTPLLLVSTGISMGLLLRYAPYLYFGNWDGQVPGIESLVTWIPIVVFGTVAAVAEYTGRAQRAHLPRG